MRSVRRPLPRLRGLRGDPCPSGKFHGRRGRIRESLRARQGSDGRPRPRKGPVGDDVESEGESHPRRGSLVSRTACRCYADANTATEGRADTEALEGGDRRADPSLGDQVQTMAGSRATASDGRRAREVSSALPTGERRLYWRLLEAPLLARAGTPYSPGTTTPL